MAQGLEQEDVLWRVRQVLLAADDVADLHVGVVDDDREVVERRAVAAEDDEVAAQVGGIDLDPAPDEIVERNRPIADAEPGRGPATLLLEPRTILRGEPGAAAAVARRLVSGLLALPFGLQLRRRAVAVVGMIRGEQGRGGLAVAIQTLHLAVRPVGAPIEPRVWVRALVPAHARPTEADQDVALVFRRRAGDVRVLDPEDEAPAAAPRKEIVEERSPDAADVKRAGGTRREPDADARGQRLAVEAVATGAAVAAGASASAASRSSDVSNDLPMG